MKKKNIKVIVIVLLLILLLFGIVEIFLFSKKGNDSHSYREENNYIISDTVVEPTGTKTYSSETLSAEHCLDSICVEDVKFYYTDAGGRIEYTVINKTDQVASGFLKLVFEKQFLIITYQDLAVGGKASTSTFYGSTIENMEDYHLEYLSSEDNKKIVYSK